MHVNSLLAYEKEGFKFSKREKEILGLLIMRNRQYTDRQIMKELGFAEPNSIRPRVSELIDSGWIVETGSITCGTTGKTVRLVEFNRQKIINQMELKI